MPTENPPDDPIERAVAMLEQDAALYAAHPMISPDLAVAIMNSAPEPDETVTPYAVGATIARYRTGLFCGHLAKARRNDRRALVLLV